MMNKNIKDVFLLASVFVTGACVLVVEIAAIRILSPHYGNTIYTASSVIGTVLAALSLGYYLGGKAADKYPKHQIFYGIIFLAGLLVLVMQLAIFWWLPALGAMLSIKTGPVISSLILFFIPAFFLGTLSPFAIKLYGSAEQAGATIGSRSGEIFFWSTMGSIVGSLSSGFLLIPNFGLINIIIGVGVVLGLWAVLAYALLKPFDARAVGIMVMLLVAMGLMVWWAKPPSDPAVIYEKDGVYEKIKVVDGVWYGQPTRFLFQDRSYSSAMYLHSDELVYDYTKYYKLYQLVKPEANEVFVIGGAAYSLPKAYLQASNTMRVDVAEIEPGLLELAKQYFRFEESPRMANYIEDGRRLLQQQEKAYDIIFSDVYYSLFTVPTHFTTAEFFTLAKSRLSEDGIFMGNFGGYAKGPGSDLMMAEMKTFRQSFPNSYFFAVVSPTAPHSQNIIFLGINGLKKIDFAALAKSKDPFFQQLPSKLINVAEYDFSHVPVLTDNYAPVEYLVGKVVDNWQ